jgi:hypothetical protein
VTEFEYLSLMNEYIDTSFSVVSVLLSLISAFLLVSYLAAKKFNNIISGLLLVMYTMAYVWIGSASWNGNFQILSFAEKMKSTDIDFAWTRFMNLEAPVFIASSLLVLSYLGSILFFFYARRLK